LFKKR